jgi:hypothetical protein
MLPNATTGLNIVIQSCSLGPGDVMFMLDIGYGSVKKMAQAATTAAGTSPSSGRDVQGPEVVMGHVRFPIRCAHQQQRGGERAWEEHALPQVEHSQPASLTRPDSLSLSPPAPLRSAHLPATIICSGPEEILAVVAEQMPASTKLAVFDAVTSNTAVVLPIQELVELCHSR